MVRNKEIRIGHPTSGIVTGYTKRYDRLSLYYIKLETDLGVAGTLAYSDLFDQETAFDEKLLPAIGSRIDTVIFNYNDSGLYLTAKPSALAPEVTQKYRQFYDYMDRTEIGEIVNGTVSSIQAFGVFVNIDHIPFNGLIEIVLCRHYKGKQLPDSQNDWPKADERIQCMVNYFRPEIPQIGLGWLPE